MNPNLERNALKRLLEINDDPDRVVRTSRRGAFRLLVTGLALIAGMAIWHRYLNDAAYILLSFGGGVFLALGYARYAETARIRIFAPFLRKDELAQKLELLARK